MKNIHLLLALLFNIALLQSFELPYAELPIHTEAGELGSLLRIDPDDTKPESLPTAAWFWYDAENLYARVECRVDSTFSQGIYCQRDSDSQGDYLYLYEAGLLRRRAAFPPGRAGWPAVPCDGI